MIKWLLLVFEVGLMGMMWACAISGFWNGPLLWTGFATGLVACMLTAAVSTLVFFMVREIWNES